VRRIGDRLEIMMENTARVWPVMLFALVLVGCASDPAETAEQQQEVAEDIEAILTQPLGEDEYVQSERCISTYKYHSVDVLDNQHVVFRGRGDNIWMNTLRAPCLGLHRRDVLQFELRTSQLCNLDDFVAVEYGISVGMKTSATCVLGDFAPVTAEQVALIKATMEKKRE
jgi:hypothetical protein